LEYLEDKCNNAPETRNVRLAAIKSFFHFLEHRQPSALEQIRRVLAIPFKKTSTRLMPYLSREEVQAVLDAADLLAEFGALCPTYGELAWHWKMRRIDPHRSQCEAAYLVVVRNSAGIAMGLRQGHCGLASMAPVARSTRCIAQASLIRAVRTMS
jgi:integrase